MSVLSLPTVLLQGCIFCVFSGAGWLRIINWPVCHRPSAVLQVVNNRAERATLESFVCVCVWRENEEVGAGVG